MIWPFRRRRAVSFAEAIADKPEPRCGFKGEHYWHEATLGRCLRCKALDERQAEERRADLIAEAVVRRMNGKAGPR